MAYIGSQERVSTLNSTSTPLAAGDTFTGPAENIVAYPGMTVAVYTDQECSFWVEFSVDGINWDSAIPYKVFANKNDVHKITRTREYFRFKIQNISTVNQTFLRVQIILGDPQQLTSGLGSQIQADADSIVVRPIDFNLAIASGLYENRQPIFKDGINFDIDAASAAEDIWGGLATSGGTYPGFPTTAPEELQVLSSNASDTGTIYFAYLPTSDSTDYLFGSAVLNGTTPVNTGITAYRVNFAYYETTDPVAFNLGNLTIRWRTTTSVVFIEIPIGYSQSFCAAFTVPKGNTAYISKITGSIRGGTATAACDGFIWYRSFGKSPRLRSAFTLNQGSQYQDTVDNLFAIPEKVDFIPRIILGTVNNTVAQVSYRLILVKN